MNRPQLVKVNSEFDMASLQVGELVRIGLNVNNNRWVVYHGIRNGKERFIGPTDCKPEDPAPKITLWEQEAKYLQFNNGSILLDMENMHRRQIEPSHPEYNQMHPLIERARIYL